MGELLQAFRGAIASRLEAADTHDGAMYDHPAGVGALMWRRVAERDQEGFRAIYFGSAENDQLDEIVERRFGVSRIRDTRGTGVAVLRRASAACADTIWAGTGIAIGTGSAPVTRYRATAHVQASASDLEVRVPIECSELGAVGAVSAVAGDLAVMRIEDQLKDSWTIASIVCANGTTRQQDSELREAVADARWAGRLGYAEAIRAACVDAGAQEVVLFPSDYLGESYDHGLNRVYVGDGNHETPEALLKACRLIIPRAAMGGSSVQILPMTTESLTMSVEVELWSAPPNAQELGGYGHAAILEYFRTRELPCVWRKNGVIAAIMRSIPDVHDVDVDPSQSQPELGTLFDTVPLPYWMLQPWDLQVTVRGPS